jgi:hypothetical protein
MGWLKKLVGFENSFSKNLTKDLFKNPTRLLTGIDPLSTKISNALTGQDNDPMVNMFGSPDKQYYDRAEADGIDTSAAQKFHKTADVIAGLAGAYGLSGIGGGAAGAAGGGGSAAAGGIGGAGAAGGGGLLGSLGGAGGVLKLGTALASAYMSNKAAKEQAVAAGDAAKLAQLNYEQTRLDQISQLAQQREDQRPYREAALPSIQNLARGLQDGGEYSRSFGLADFDADPGRLYRLSQGEQGINRAAAARGGWNSGATLKALARFNSDLASQEYGNAYSRFNTDRTTKFNRNATMAGYGQTANSAVGNAGTQAYGQIANAGQNNAQLQGRALQDAGEARASGYVGATNALGSGIKSIFDSYQQSQYLKPGGTSGTSSNGDVPNWQGWGQ